MGLADAGVKLLAEVVLAMFLRPLGVDIFLCAFVRLPRNRHDAFLDGLSLVAFISLDRCLHQGSVDDLAAARQVAMCQLLLHLVKQFGTQARLRQAVAEQPDRLGVGDCAALGKAEKLQKTAAIQQLILERIVS